jgi:hypothetical protein
MLLLTKMWRELLIVLLLLSTYVLGKLYWQKPKEVQVPVLTEKIVEVEKIVERTVTKVVTTLPDGTTIVKDETKDTSKDTAKDNSKQTTPTVVKLNPYRYSVGVSIRDLDYKDFLVEAGIRLATSPLVATVGFDVKPRSFLLGVRYEF